MEEKQSAGLTGNSGSDMEASILSAHRKFFEGNAHADGRLKRAESILYDTVIRFFTGNS